MIRFLRNILKYFYLASRLSVYITTNVRQYHTRAVTEAFKPDTNKMRKKQEIKLGRAEEKKPHD